MLADRVLPLVVVACAMAFTTSAHAREFFFVRVPNPTYMTNEVGMSRPCITCHNNPNGGQGCLTMGGMAPCLNPFGMQFRANNFEWTPALAMMDADGDGFTNGQELQDPNGTFVEGDDPPGIPSYHTRPGFPTDSPGFHDADGDRYCYFGYDMNGDGQCSGAENLGSLDCDDRMSGVNSGATERCDNAIDDDCNGQATLDDAMCVMVVDRDNDGFCTTGHDTNRDRDCGDAGEMGDPVDCDDMLSTRYPTSNENCIDGVDNDCNMLVDRDDARCMGDTDNDGDGYCLTGQDLDANQRCNDSPAEIGGASDCDDDNAAVSPMAMEACEDRIDNDCDGDVDYADSMCSTRGDADQDGFCPMGRDTRGATVGSAPDGDCSDEGEDIPVSDCNDANAAINPSATENCTNGRDDDCDGSTDLRDRDPDDRLSNGMIVLHGCTRFLDLDGDRYCPAGFDVDRDEDCSESREVMRGTDCNDASNAVSPESPEICTDNIDNDCNGVADARDPACAEQYFDFDNDGYCGRGHDTRGAVETTPPVPDGDCNDPDEQTADVDAAPRDSAISPGEPERCFDRKDNDQDGLVDLDDPHCQGDAAKMDTDDDGYCIFGRDLNADDDCLDDGENVGVSDCRPADGTIHPGLSENTILLCTNGRDDDCDGNTDQLDVRDQSMLGSTAPQDCALFLDSDGDGFCPMGVNDTAPNDHDCLGEAENRFGSDCNDEAMHISARAREMCTDTIDNDCDGAIDLADTECLCMMTTPCADNDPCTIDRCTADGQLCEHVTDPACLDPVDAGPIDMGPTEMPDAGVDAGSVADASPDATPRTAGPSGGGGCGCRVSASRDARGAWWVGLGIGLVLLGIRASRRSSRGVQGAAR